MRRRISAILAMAVLGVAAWVLVAQVAAVGATAGTLTIGAPTLVQLQSSTHNGGLSPACGSHVDPVAGTEGQGVIQDGRGSYVGAVQLPQGATVTSLSVTAHDFTDPGDVYAFLVRKSALKQSLFIGKYNVLADVHSTGAQDKARKFTSTSISNGGIDNSAYGYWVELVNCDSTIQPTAVQIGYTTP
jgi:hypothetical protein